MRSSQLLGQPSSVHGMIPCCLTSSECRRTDTCWQQTSRTMRMYCPTSSLRPGAFFPCCLHRMSLSPSTRVGVGIDAQVQFRPLLAASAACTQSLCPGSASRLCSKRAHTFVLSKKDILSINEFVTFSTIIIGA